MSMTTNTSSPGLLAKPQNLTPLWTQLLQKHPPALSLSSTSSGTPMKAFPPIAPMDKAGTSMRILLHDTQAQFEKFSERIIKLTDGVEDTRREMSISQKLFESEHEKLLDDIVELANRCQTQIQKSVGNPAQALQVDALNEKLSAVDGRLSALDNKLDVLQMFTQTQSQALQTLQNQQSQLLALLAPVTPLLQAIPLHVENAKHDVKDAIAQSHRTCSLGQESGSRDHMTPASSPTHRLSRKRRRMDSPEQDDLSMRRSVHVFPTPRPSASQPRRATPSPSSPPASSSTEIDSEASVTLMNPDVPDNAPVDAYFHDSDVGSAVSLADPVTSPTTSAAAVTHSTPTPQATPDAPATAQHCIYQNRSSMDILNTSASTLTDHVDGIVTTHSNEDLLVQPPHANTPLQHTPQQMPIKPLSLKDIRARNLFGDSLVANSAKRFIPIDEDEEDVDD